MTYSKYRNVKTNGSASRCEAKRKRELELMERAGVISDLRCQVPFVLIPAQYAEETEGPRGGVIRGDLLERSCKYIADFVYCNADGKTVVEDAKGYRTPEYIIKRKLMLFRFGIRIQEV